MVEAARIAYRDFPTVVNEVPESGVSYDNTLSEYARMDIQMQNAQKAIGGSSDTAQISQSYMWDKVARGELDDEYKQLYDNTVILAVCAQLAIDGCKKMFDVDVNDDIKRIRSQKVMTREKDYPYFMKYTHKIKTTKNGKDRPPEEIKKERANINARLDYDIVCPMNWLQECLDKIQGASKRNTIDTLEFLIEKPSEKPNNRQISKIRKIVEDYDAFTKYYFATYDENDPSELEIIEKKTNEVINSITGIKTSKATVYRLIETSLGNMKYVKKDKQYFKATKYTTKMLNMLYNANKDKFLSCFLQE